MGFKIRQSIPPNGAGGNSPNTYPWKTALGPSMGPTLLRQSQTYKGNPLLSSFKRKPAEPIQHSESKTKG
jgi:hypothetical protein